MFLRCFVIFKLHIYYPTCVALWHKHLLCNQMILLQEKKNY